MKKKKNKQKPVHQQLEEQKNEKHDTRGAKCIISSLCCRGEEARHDHLFATFTHTAYRRPSRGWRRAGKDAKTAWVNRLNTDLARSLEKKTRTKFNEQADESEGRRHIPGRRDKKRVGV